MQDKKDFGMFIREKRKEKNYTQDQLAEMLYVTKSAVSKWERGVSYPDISMIGDICRVLDVSEHELITSSSDNETRAEKRQAHLYRVIRGTYFYVAVISYAVALLTCFICNLAIDGTLSWFWVVFASLLCAYTFVPGVYIYFGKHRVAAFSVSTCVGVVVLLAVCALYTGGMYWFPTAGVSVLLGYAIVFLPYIFGRYLPASRGRYKFVLTCAAAAALTVLLIGAAEIVRPFDFFAALAVGAYFLFPLFACACICLARVHRLVKAGFCVLTADCFQYFSGMFIRLCFGGDIWQDYAVDFTDWAACVSGNAALIVFVTIYLAGAALIAAGLILRRKKK